MSDLKTILAMKPGSELNQAVAVALFGWGWRSFVGIPTKGTPNYPQKQRVRQFMSTVQLEHPRWKAFLAKNEGAPATGDEPLSYAYCSSQGNDAMLPCYSTDISDAWEVHKLDRLFSQRQAYFGALQEQISRRVRGDKHGDGILLAWPDLFGMLEPVDICKAAVVVALTHPLDQQSREERP